MGVPNPVSYDTLHSSQKNQIGNTHQWLKELVCTLANDSFHSAQNNQIANNHQWLKKGGVPYLDI